MRYELTIHLALSYTSDNEHAVLRAEVHNHHCLWLTSGWFLGDRPLAALLLSDLEIGGYFDIVAGGDSVIVQPIFLVGRLYCH
jgi:hypothetical protein